MRYLKTVLCVVILTATLMPSQGFCADANSQSEVKELREEMRQMKSDYESRIKALEDKIADISEQSENQQAGATEAPTPSAAPAQSKLIDISFDGLFTAGTSSATEDEIRRLQLYDHEPKKRGFNAVNLELAMAGVVDPYFMANVNIVYKIDEEGETGVELEETFLTSTSLPHGLQLKAGTYFTEFGRLNWVHPHAWSFVDQPVILTRLLGADGLRGPGARLSWLAPTKWYSEFQVGTQNANGETAVSFHGIPGETISDASNAYPIGIETAPGVFEARQVHKFRDMLKTTRWLNSFDLSDTSTLNLGFSGAFGANGSGRDAQASLYGMDVYFKHKPLNAERGYPFQSFQAEFMGRRYGAGEYIDSTGAIALPKITLKDSGYYAQYEWGFKPQWVAATRFDHADGSNNNSADFLRDSRRRFSTNLTFFPSEFSKIRLQYNRDSAQHLTGGSEQSVWLQYEFMIGAHGAHKF